MSRTVEEARREVLENLDDGITCPCCGRVARRGRQQISRAMAMTLAWLGAEHKKSRGRWVHVPTEGRRWSITSNSHGKLRHWGLVEAKSNDDDPSKKESGKYRITRAGWEFLQGKTSVRRSAVVYNNELEGFEGPLVTITDCFGNDFDFRELMRLYGGDDD